MTDLTVKHDGSANAPVVMNGPLMLVTYERVLHNHADVGYERNTLPTDKPDQTPTAGGKE